ncbi:hypothetical protein KIW84_014618 [Lathyrus oleraceus]|uniref:Reverse transcriptase zinc-binding domain-containing protein n=1 Tax=Pisum sativum TaxID=3888 RepID=A0A9D5BNQ7_PEA|nr:hypothetical protein KIW84_014618 [Pisum sativum]
MPGIVTLPLPNFDNASSSTTRGGLITNENVAELPIENMVEPLIDNVVDPLIMIEVVQPAEPVEKIHVRRPVRQKQHDITDDFVVYLSDDAYYVDSSLERGQKAMLRGVWRAKFPSKIQMFRWRFLLDKLPTRAQLAKRGTLQSNKNKSVIPADSLDVDIKSLYLSITATSGH